MNNQTGHLLGTFEVRVSTFTLVPADRILPASYDHVRQAPITAAVTLGLASLSRCTVQLDNLITVGSKVGRE